MPEERLLDAYLERLDTALPLPESERRAAVEEIAAHVSMTVDELMPNGIPREVAERRALERLGAPERLADDLAAAHRLPGHVLAAAGTAVRVSLVTALQAFIVAWAGVFVIAILLGLAVAGVRQLMGTGFLQVDWSPLLDGLLPAVVGGLVAYVVGRALIGPVARAARRHPAEVRRPLLVAGGVIAAVIGLTAIDARWTLGSAVLMASMPAWFALGVLRPDLAPAWRVNRSAVLIAIVIALVGAASLALLGGSVSGGSVESRAIDPNVEYAAIGPFVSLEQPPVRMAGDGSGSGVPSEGPGPVRIERTGTVASAFENEWSGVRLEVWQGPVGGLDGPILDPSATGPLAVAPMTVHGGRLSGELEFMPLPDRHVYYVAITGLDADGERWQLAWPGIEPWLWRGTPLELFLTTWR